MTNADDSITAPQRLAVRQLAAIGAPLEVIRQLHGCGPDGALLPPERFRQLFAADLARGQAQADAEVARTLFELSSNGKSVQATLAWAKQRLGWSGEQETSSYDRAAQPDTAAAFGALQSLLDEFAALKSSSPHTAPQLAEGGAPQPITAGAR